MDNAIVVITICKHYFEILIYQISDIVRILGKHREMFVLLVSGAG